MSDEGSGKIGVDSKVLVYSSSSKDEVSYMGIVLQTKHSEDDSELLECLVQNTENSHLGEEWVSVDFLSPVNETSNRDELANPNSSNSPNNQESPDADNAMETDKVSEEDYEEKKRRSRSRGTGKRRQNKNLDLEYESLPVKIPLPQQLRKKLNDDMSFISQNREIVPLPCKPNVADILDGWKKESSIVTPQVEEILEMIKSLFHEILGSHLLYKLERTQYREILTKYPKSPLSQLYGAEHLLRFFVKLPWILSNVDMDEILVESIKNVVFDIMEYMKQNLSTLFVPEYEAASQEAIDATP